MFTSILKIFIDYRKELKVKDYDLKIVIYC